MNITRLTALLEKDWKEAIRNPSIIFMPLVIILISAFYGFIPSNGAEENATEAIQLITLNLAFVMTANAPIITMFAEENEKGTLKGLIESPALTIEILLSKVLIMTIITVATSFISLIILGFDIQFSITTYLGLLIMLCFYLSLGLILGLLSNSVGTATSLMMIPYVFLGMTPILDMMKETLDLGFFEQILSILPYGLIFKLQTDDAVINILYLAIWLLISLIALYFTYKSKFRKQ
ncbi:ABC transporter permease [Staphylococcus caeli]|uniref:ABC transporter permease n=1 Tax=Staphylococcus caeli TaxID=2201815 RepID=UPI003F55A49F